MAKYRFKQDSIQKYRVYDSNIGTSSSVDQSITFKKGDIVDGVFTPSHKIGGGRGIMAETTIPDTILVPNPNINKGLFNGNGASSWFSISPDVLELSSDQSSASKTNSNSLLKPIGNINMTAEDKLYEKLGIKFTNSGWGLKSRPMGRLLVLGVLIASYFAYKKFNK